MKTRSDFVSNSSSSSFVIYGKTGSVALMSKRFKENFEGLQQSDSLSKAIDIRVLCKNKWYRDVWNFFNVCKEDKCQFEDFYKDFSTGKNIQKDPEQVGWEGIYIQLDDIKKIASNPEILLKIDHVEFSTRDENDSEQLSYLTLLFRFMEVIGCFPDKSCSDIDFIEQDDDEYLSKMRSIVAKFDFKREEKERDFKKKR